jgi:hypothetical protein
VSIENKKRYSYSLKPGKCPSCGGSRIAVILYGMPHFTDKLDSDIAEGKVVLGGCCLTDDDPAWQCADCDMVLYGRG